MGKEAKTGIKYINKWQIKTYPKKLEIFHKQSRGMFPEKHCLKLLRCKKEIEEQDRGIVMVC